MPTIATKPVFRELANVRVEGRELVVGILPTGAVSVRLKGGRRVVEVPALHIYEMGRRLERAERRRARAAARAERRLARLVENLPDAGDGITGAAAAAFT